MTRCGVVKISFDWGNKRLNDDALVFVKGLSELKEMQLGGAENIPGKGLVHLKGIKSLTGLALDATKITDSGIDTLAMLPALEGLTMNGTQVTDKGVAKLAGIKTLKLIWLSGTAVTDSGLKELADLPKLETLQIANTKVTDKGVGDIEDRISKTACRSVTMSKERVRCLAGHRCGGIHSL